MTTAPRAVPPAALAPGRAVRHRGLFLALVCSAQFVLLVGGTVVTVSLPAIRRDLGLDDTQLQWVLTAFALTFGCLLLLGGRAADVFGRRRVFLVGVAVFAGGSLLCAVASGPGLLIAARALAGAGAAMASPAAMSLLTSVFVTPRDRSTALGAWAAVGAMGATLGNVLGGLLTSAGGWRWIFLINVPVCVVAFAGAFALVPVLPRERRRTLGVGSGLLATAGVGALIVGFGQLQVDGPGPVAFGAFAAAALAVAMFVGVQARSADPLLPPALFRRRTSVGFLLVFVSAATGIGAYFSSSLYMQETLGWSALSAGLAFVPWAATTALVAQVVSRNLHRLGPRLLVPGALLVVAVGAALLGLQLAPAAGYGSLLVPFLLLGSGTGAVGVSCTVIALSGVPRRRHGVGAGALNSTQPIGSAIAVAVVALLSGSAAARALAGGAEPVAAVLAGQRFALLVVAGVAVCGAVLAALVLPARVPVPAEADEDVVLSRPASAPLS